MPEQRSLQVSKEWKQVKKFLYLSKSIEESNNWKSFKYGHLVHNLL